MRKTIALLAPLWLLAQTLQAQTDSPPTEPFHSISEVRTDPAGAQVYLNWEYKGETPLILGDLTPGQILLVLKTGYEGRYRKIDTQRSFYFKLAPAKPIETRRILLQVIGEEASKFRYQLVERLIGAGFFIFTEDDIESFANELTTAVSKARDAFLAWAWTQYRSHLWIIVSLPGADPQLDSSQSLIRDDLMSLPESFLAGRPSISLRIIDLRDGELFYHAYLDATDFFSGRAQNRTRARDRLTKEITMILHDQILGASASGVPSQGPQEPGGG